MTVPSLFISHGGPNIVLEDTPARKYLQTLTELVGKPSAIVICSAHFETRGAAVVADPAPGMIYDFAGFPDELYKMVYSAPGDPALARRVAGLLEDHEIEHGIITERGYDHGTWTPLLLAFPQADIPVVQVSIDPARDANYHYRLGRALSPLKQENILIIGSGHITHNLREVFSMMRGGGAASPQMVEKVDAFTGWIADKFAEQDHEALLEWAGNAPYARENHPTDEHLMPLFFAFGAGGSAASARRTHDSRQFGFFAFDSWMFA